MAADDFTIMDKNDNPIRVGSTIQVTAPNLKAYQVPPKGYGTFDEDGTFVPAPNDGDRTSKSLQIPIGLTGVVTKLYNEAEISANFQIQVKFVPGAFPEANYDLPVSFLMHFAPREVETMD